MQKKSLFKIAALFTLLGFFLLSVPGLSSAPKKSSKFDFGVLIKKPVAWISSFVSIFTPAFDTGSPDTSNTVDQDNTSGKIKALGDSLSLRPSKSD
jgi:hypothetical protein